MRKGVEYSLAMAGWLSPVAVAAGAANAPGAGTLVPALVSVPILALAARHIQVVRRSDRRAGKLTDCVARLELAEQLAGVGRWVIDPGSDNHDWSENFCAMAGVDPDTFRHADNPFALLGRSGSQVAAVLESHRNDRTVFPIEFQITRRDGEERVLRARVRNLFGADGSREKIMLVVRDVTEEYRLFETMSRDRSDALEMAREAQFLANTDPLTGLANRRYVMGELDRSVFAARKDGAPLSLLIFDIDHFKRVNDTHGHQTGDAVLRKVADLARSRIGSRDLLARIGGEEFLWILPGVDTDEASAAAERLRWTIEAGTLSAPFPAVTISIGNATLAPSDASLSLFARADAALYEAKRAGRNQVRLAA